MYTLKQYSRTFNLSLPPTPLLFQNTRCQAGWHQRVPMAGHVYIHIYIETSQKQKKM